MKLIKEQGTEFYTLEIDKLGKRSGFYNPKMKFNRDISVLLLKAFGRTKMNIALPFAATGVRGLRFFNELGNSVEMVNFNDKDEKAVDLIHRNVEHNNINKNKYTISCKEADPFILDQTGLDYIDVDPYGTPLKFLDSAVERMKSGSIIAVTATDLAALTSNVKSCKRKYDAVPCNNEIKHEIGLRILVRKCQLVGTLYEKALVPLLCFYKDHYYRCFFKVVINNRTICNELVNNHRYFLYCKKCLNRLVSGLNSGTCKCGSPFTYFGRIFCGSLYDHDLIRKMYSINKNHELIDFLQLVLGESRRNVIGFYDMKKINKVFGLNGVKMNDLLRLNKGVKTHFSVSGFKCGDFSLSK